MSRKRGLGRGLDSLIPSMPEGEVSAGELRHIGLDLIDPNPFQPRRSFDEKALESLAASIRSQGVLEPLRLRPLGDRFQVVFGERRLRASKLAGLAEVPAVVEETEDSSMRILALVENLQREDLGPLEEADALAGLVEILGTQEAVAEQVGKDRATVANAIRLLGLPPEVKDLLSQGRIQAGHARTLLGLESAAAMIEMAGEVVRRGLTVRQAEALVRARSKSGRSRKPKAAAAPGAAPRELLDALVRKLGTRVRAESAPRGGHLVVDYYSDEDLRRIAELILGPGGA